MKESKILKTVETNTEVYQLNDLEPKFEMPLISQVPIIEATQDTQRESFGKKKKKSKKGKAHQLSSPPVESPEKPVDFQPEI